ncbi:alpha/beta fold hydrolase [Halovenus sp. WSH3]|uniref:Alpha/beta fold hydrolase n=1 Tax=Halovenus carboxidivorans TaxID=2692199 RepID=A0A6B0T3M8_9EURY|nr:alpha/beta fold hydrolase [Halovenus carboxidivorans]
MTETVRANGIEFGYHRRGDGDRLALCLHGFPDDARSLAPITERLAAEGFTTVSPYLRGYGPTDPAPDGDYSAGALGRDALALAEAMLEREGCSEAVLIGHDWGAVAGYAAARQDPERFSHLVTMAVPPGFSAELLRSPRQLLRSWYVWLFQFPGVAERVLAAEEFALIEQLWRLWSPGWQYDEDHLAGVIETFQTDGTPEAALQYYRQFVNPTVKDLARNGPPSRDSLPSIDVPGLVIAGERDGCVGAELFEDADTLFTADCRVLKIREAGHFMHRERPAVVGEEIISFLGAD